MGLAVMTLISSVNDHNNNLILFGFEDKNGDIGDKYRVILKLCFDWGMVLEVRVKVFSAYTSAIDKHSHLLESHFMYL